jgi:hypothetical protein
MFTYITVQSIPLPYVVYNRTSITRKHKILCFDSQIIDLLSYLVDYISQNGPRGPGVIGGGRGLFISIIRSDLWGT